MTRSVNALRALAELNYEKDIIRREFEYNDSGDITAIKEYLPSSYPVTVVITNIIIKNSGDIDRIITKYGVQQVIEIFEYDTGGNIVGSTVTQQTVAS